MSEERFPIWLARQLDRKRWTQTELALRIGTNSSVVSRWVRGERVPDPKSIDKIADVLGFKPDYVMMIAGHLPHVEGMKGDDPREELVAIVEALAPGKLDAALRILRGLHESKADWTLPE